MDGSTDNHIALACHALVNEVIRDMPEVPPGVVNLIIGDGPSAGQALARSPKLPLISATGSVRMGRSVATTVAARMAPVMSDISPKN